eukprot:CAMPEP_0169143142 /NCGR_PEP_ID=MMETSP1015-20121227/45406_1 /TAXON_ID=342587 /ORGANISM="Karlodinium micrum, Strain CCMP2283" /LENGTH=180 /DNA_ID=CAMNT_0009210017 /DNA_START=144 /DNA_END=686 /DNA_ORIENTATION=-
MSSTSSAASLQTPSGLASRPTCLLRDASSFVEPSTFGACTMLAFCDEALLGSLVIISASACRSANRWLSCEILKFLSSTNEVLACNSLRRVASSSRNALSLVRGIAAAMHEEPQLDDSARTGVALGTICGRGLTVRLTRGPGETGLCPWTVNGDNTRAFMGDGESKRDPPTLGDRVRPAG